MSAFCGFCNLEEGPLLLLLPPYFSLCVYVVQSFRGWVFRFRNVFPKKFAKNLSYTPFKNPLREPSFNFSPAATVGRGGGGESNFLVASQHTGCIRPDRTKCVPGDTDTHAKRRVPGTVLWSRDFWKGGLTPLLARPPLHRIYFFPSSFRQKFGFVPSFPHREEVPKRMEQRGAGFLGAWNTKKEERRHLDTKGGRKCILPRRARERWRNAKKQQHVESANAGGGIHLGDWREGGSFYESVRRRRISLHHFWGVVRSI